MTSKSKFPLKKIWDVAGNSTESLWWSANKMSKKINNDETIIFLMIPGNPGVISYYIPFLTTIYNKLEQRVEVIGVSNLGHSHGPHNTFDTLYSLQEQIDHKIQCFDDLREKFSKDYVQPKFILCGHSIGAYMCSQVLKERPNHGIINVYSLFPTLQHIQKTPNGIMLNFLFGEHQRNLASSFVQSLRYLLAPTVFKFIVKLCTFQSEPHLSVTTEQLLHGPIVKNTLYMANTEMATVNELDENLYRQHLDKFIFYFGVKDNWAPLKHYNDMLTRFPDGKIYLCDQGMPHAFIFDYSETMGNKVASWIEKAIDEV